jgi:DNA-binding NarL/FixJ family response regulator
MQKNPASRIILMTVHNDSALLEQGFSAGALGYVLKLKAEDELSQAIHSALEDKRFISPQVANSSLLSRNIDRPTP